MHRPDKIQRSIVKSITFRILIVIADLIVIYALTRKLELAVGFIVFSNLTSTVIYFFHERLWNKITWGKKTK